MNRTILFLAALATALGLFFGGWHWQVARGATWVQKVCHPIGGGTAYEDAPAAWMTENMTPTRKAYLRSLGWEIYVVFADRVRNHLPNIGDPSYTCAQVFDQTIPLVESQWDGVIDP